MEEKGVFEPIQTMQRLSNHAVIQWTKATRNNIGISPILVLVELKLHGPQKQSDLAQTLGFTPGAITNIANKLIESQLAERKYDSSDRRIIYLDITEKGMDVLKDAKQQGQFVYEQLFQVLNDTEIQQFLSIYEKLIRNIN